MRNFRNYTKRKVEQRDHVVDVVVDALLQEEIEVQVQPVADFFVMHPPAYEQLSTVEAPENLPVESSATHSVHCVPCDFRGEARFICHSQTGEIIAMRHHVMIHPNEHVVMNRFAVGNFHHDGFLDSLKSIYTCVLILRYLKDDHVGYDDVVDYLCTKIVQDIEDGEKRFGEGSYNMDAVHRALERG
ncbi:MAG: hypothetical protein CMI52_02370 [Parcubacteria group bacterium]|nr:hypothetical protein [Parcubacteria group bacterium]|tara:strand:- start:212 stop:772 length:561 start_codon:yes stop_codon:yes gene_type:complete